MTTTQYDLTYECSFDGELGSLISLDAVGHLDYLEAELFLADVVPDELESGGYDECPTFGLEIEHLWRSEHPLDIDPEEIDDGFSERWTYHYTAQEREGAAAVTRFQVASPWAREATGPTAHRAIRDHRTGEHTIEGVDSWPLMCIHHPDEPAITAVPEDRFSDAGDKTLDGSIYYCSPCMRAFEQRTKVATEKSLAPVRTAEFLEVFTGEIVATAFTHTLYREDLSAAVDGRDEDGSARRRLRAFEDAYRATGAQEHRSIATAQPGYKVLMLSDIHWLVDDYTHRTA